MSTTAAARATRVVIAGGGLVGLTLARLLAKRDLTPVVIERMRPGDHVRRGFMLGHHGFPALADIGELDHIAAAIAVEVGLVLKRLEDGVEVRHQHVVADLVRDGEERVTGVVVEGPDGRREIEADLVVACDGLRSGVRGMAGIRADFRTMAEGKIEWMSPVPAAESFAMAYLSNGGHIGMLSWPDGSFGWRTTERVGREEALAPSLDALVESWSRLLPEAAEAVRGLRSMDELFYSEPTLLSCPEWWVPGVVVIGDAAHFFGPETGASAGVGLADAHALAEAIGANRRDADAACRVYESWRSPTSRRLEDSDPGRMRLEGAPIREPRPEERWPPLLAPG